MDHLFTQILRIIYIRKPKACIRKSDKRSVIKFAGLVFLQTNKKINGEGKPHKVKQGGLKWQV